MGNPSRRYRASATISEDQRVLPATRHRLTRSALIPTRLAGTRFTYRYTLEGPKAELTIVLVMQLDGLTVSRQSPIWVLTIWWRPNRESNEWASNRTYSVLTVTLSVPSHQCVPLTGSDDVMQRIRKDLVFFVVFFVWDKKVVMHDEHLATFFFFQNCISYTANKLVKVLW